MKDDNTTKIGFAPYQATIGDLEITLTSEHGDHLQKDQPAEDQLILEIAKSGEKYREIFDDLHADEITDLRESLEDIERIFHQLEEHQTHAWQCTDCGKTLITEGHPDTCDCGSTDWEKDRDLEQLSEEAWSVLQHLYVLEPGETLEQEALTARIEAETDKKTDTIDDALDELIDAKILDRADNGLQRY